MLGLSNCHAVAAFASQGTLVSGSFQSSFVHIAGAVGPLAASNKLGNGTYSVSYNYPSQVDVGSNFTTHVSLKVDELNGLQELTFQYQVTVQLGLPNGSGMIQAVSGTAPLYPGAIWGPKNVSIPITEANTGLSSGQIANATVVIRLGITTYVGYPFNQPAIQTMIPPAKAVGNTTIFDQAGPGGALSGGSPDLMVSLTALLPYLTLCVGVILLFVGAFYSRLFHEREIPLKT